MFYDSLPKPFFVLAPMDDVTDSVFRRIVASTAAPDMYYTEFVNVDGLMSPGRPKLLKKLQFTPGERPLIAQLWGLKPENFRAIAQQVADGSQARELGLPEGGYFAGIDLNMVVVQGTGEGPLKKGPAHYTETPLPGTKGNWTVGIAGHRTTYQAPFRNLDKLKRGDQVVV
jgi:hypothetical protein